MAGFSSPESSLASSLAPSLLRFISMIYLAPLKSYKFVYVPRLYFYHVPPSLSDKCREANGGCSHQCSVIPGKGAVCSCPTGLHLGSDNRSCEVVDYCSRHLKCSQSCEQQKTVVKCSCYPGWSLEPDGESCYSTGTMNG